MRHFLAISLAIGLASGASGASSFTSSLTGFTGNSTEAATQAAVNAAGLNFFSTDGLDLENFDKDPTVLFDGTGAHFGVLFGGDGGRNYMRTNDSDYATVNFVAEVTFSESGTVGGPGVGEQIFFGMGAGNAELYRVPDWSSENTSTFVTPENGASDGILTTWRSANDANAWVNGPANPGLAGGGTHRLQMSFDNNAKTMTYAIDFNYAGGPFVADLTADPVDLNHIDCDACGYPAHPISADFFAADGWPNEPSRIYFGGDDEAIFTDFSVTVSSVGVSGDYNGNGTADAADYVLWRDNPAGFGGSPAGYNTWRSNFGNSSGSGSSLGATGVPEPTSLALVLGLMSCAALSRGAHSIKRM